MKAWLVVCLMLAAGLGLGGVYYKTTAPALSLDTGVVPSPFIGLPKTDPNSLVFLISGASGWGEPESQMAARLQAAGAVLVGIDLPAWLQALQAEKRDCAYTVSALESISRQVQRQMGLEGYHAPLVAGIGAGGGMALAMAAQTPAATIGAVFAVDPQSYLALEKPLCTPAPRLKVSGGLSYGLRSFPLPHPLKVLWSPEARPEDQAHVAALRAGHPELMEGKVADPAADGLVGAVSDYAAAQSRLREDLPLAVSSAKPGSATMAIIVSGDGGWRDIDKKVAGFLAERGIPSVGLDALRYFWRERTPEELARDLEHLIDQYGQSFGAEQVMLVGYSFGANVLPASLSQMKPAYRQRIVLLSLLAPSPKADFQIAVTGWLGFAGEGRGGDVADAVLRLGSLPVQCIYGLSEKESACHALEGPARAGQRIEIEGIPGGHHFDGNYRALTERILKALQRRLET